MRFPTLVADTIQTEPSVTPRWLRRRRILVFVTLLALAAVGAWVVTAPSRAVDPDLARVIGFMALIKVGLTAVILATCRWRLARPARLWRAVAYVAGPPLMAFGVILLWSLCGLGLGALGFHLGLLGVLAAALTDDEFFPDPRHRDG